MHRLRRSRVAISLKAKPWMNSVMKTKGSKKKSNFRNSKTFIVENVKTTNNFVDTYHVWKRSYPKLTIDSKSPDEIIALIQQLSTVEKKVNFLEKEMENKPGNDRQVLASRHNTSPRHSSILRRSSTYSPRRTSEHDSCDRPCYFPRSPHSLRRRPSFPFRPMPMRRRRNRAKRAASKGNFCGKFSCFPSGFWSFNRKRTKTRSQARPRMRTARRYIPPEYYPRGGCRPRSRSSRVSWDDDIKYFSASDVNITQPDITATPVEQPTQNKDELDQKIPSLLKLPENHGDEKIEQKPDEPSNDDNEKKDEMKKDSLDNVVHVKIRIANTDSDNAGIKLDTTETGALLVDAAQSGIGSSIKQIDEDTIVRASFLPSPSEIGKKLTTTQASTVNPELSIATPQLADIAHREVVPVPVKDYGKASCNSDDCRCKGSSRNDGNIELVKKSLEMTESQLSALEKAVQNDSATNHEIRVETEFGLVAVTTHDDQCTCDVCQHFGSHAISQKKSVPRNDNAAVISKKIVRVFYKGSYRNVMTHTEECGCDICTRIEEEVHRTERRSTIISSDRGSVYVKDHGRCGCKNCKTVIINKPSHELETMLSDISSSESHNSVTNFCIDSNATAPSNKSFPDEDFRRRRERKYHASVPAIESESENDFGVRHVDSQTYNLNYSGNESNWAEGRRRHAGTEPHIQMSKLGRKDATCRLKRKNSEECTKCLNDGEHPRRRSSPHRRRHLTESRRRCDKRETSSRSRHNSVRRNERRGYQRGNDERSARASTSRKPNERPVSPRCNFHRKLEKILTSAKVRLKSHSRHRRLRRKVPIVSGGRTNCHCQQCLTAVIVSDVDSEELNLGNENSPLKTTLDPDESKAEDSPTSGKLTSPQVTIADGLVRKPTLEEIMRDIINGRNDDNEKKMYDVTLGEVDSKPFTRVKIIDNSINLINKPSSAVTSTTSRASPFSGDIFCSDKSNNGHHQMSSHMLYFFHSVSSMENIHCSKSLTNCIRGDSVNSKSLFSSPSSPETITFMESDFSVDLGKECKVDVAGATAKSGEVNSVNADVIGQSVESESEGWCIPIIPPPNENRKRVSMKFMGKKITSIFRHAWKKKKRHRNKFQSNMSVEDPFAQLPEAAERPTPLESSFSPESTSFPYSDNGLMARRSPTSFKGR